MKRVSREFALSRSWDSVFDGVYETYGEAKKYLAAVRQRQKEERERQKSNHRNGK